MDSQSRKALRDKYKEREVVGGVYRIVCGATGDSWLKSTCDMQGSKNRFEFSKSTDTCVESGPADKWRQYGAKAFSFEVVEELKKGALQTSKEFAQDTYDLMELWQEKEQK